MNWRPRTWMLLSLLLFAAAWLCWRLGEERRAAGLPAQPGKTSSSAEGSGKSAAFNFPWKKKTPAAVAAQAKPFNLMTVSADPRFPYRLTNTRKTGDAMFRSETAILLRHAFIDTADGGPPRIPDHLRAAGDPGSYIVQVKGAIDAAFARQVTASGATIVSYMPNNAYLVAAPVEVAQQLARSARVQAVVPFEPYYKFSSDLIGDAVQGVPQPAERELNVVMFPGTRERALSRMTAIGAEPIGEQPSPFGPVVTVRGGGNTFVALAQMPEVHLVEARHERKVMNDLSRVRVGVSSDTVTNQNFLGLTGTGVRVAVIDNAVDGSHPDLSGRVITDATNFTAVNSDVIGHGTHVAGTIAGFAAGYAGVVVGTNGANGSVAGASFRGIAHNSFIYPQPLTNTWTDSMLLSNAARTNISISCNPWGYNIPDYDIAAAIYDAGVRDARPEMPGDQQMNIVFPAGNDGNGNPGGNGGVPGSILSPGTGKNVITVGAIEQFRQLILGGLYDPSTDSSDQVVDFSSRGNVGLGIEGIFGRFKPDLVAPGAFLLSLRSSGFTNNANPLIAALDNATSPSGQYRFESGTSMASAVVSGMLALMQEYFAAAPFNRTNSPALNKALLINGSRSAGLSYDRQVQNQVNLAGWGIPLFTNTLPSNNIAISPVQFIDQDPTNAVATGDVRVYQVTVNNSSSPNLTTNFPLRITLVWTDPPGNPAAGPKLVNNLDLVVSNAMSTNIFIYEGNNIPGGSDYTVADTPGTPPLSDIINNVENVFITAPLPTNVFYIYVIGRRVNVNAVTANTNGIVQDFALVVSTDTPNYVTLTQLPSAQTNTALISVTNGIPLFDQRLGANFPTSNVPSTNFVLSGSTNQWRFFVFSNTFIPAFTNISTNFLGGTTNMVTNITQAPLTNGSNVAIMVFLPPNLSRARTIGEADVDLYVTRNDPALTNLSQNVISNCLAGNVPNYFASTNRTGTEIITFTPALASDVFYIGVKSEDQQAATFNLAVISTDKPFTSTNGGAITVNFFPLPIAIPDGSPEAPGGVTLFGICTVGTNIVSFTMTNVLVHENVGDTVGTVTHDGISVVLNNHNIGTNNIAGGLITNVFIYNDANTNGPANSPDGPGSIVDFVGQNSIGLWTLTFVDSALEHTGFVSSVDFILNSRTNPPNTNIFTLFSNACNVDFFDVPIGATNLTIDILPYSTSPIDISFFVGFGYIPSQQTNDGSLLNITGATNFVIDLNSSPPLRPGRWFFQTCNNTANTVQETNIYRVGLDLTTVSYVDIPQRNMLAMLDNYRTNSVITNTDLRVVTGVEVSVEIDHPRGADLALYLVSPSLRRILLMENRGGTNAGIYANFTEDTNKVTTVITNLGPPIGFLTYPNLLPPKFVMPPYTNILSPPLFVNSNAYNSSAGADDTATSLAFQGNRLAMGGILTNFGGAFGDGQIVNYATPVTNNPTSLLWSTNWPGALGGGRSGSTFFNGVSISTDGTYLSGVTKDYFPTPQSPSGGATPDIYDLDTGTTNGTVVITYNFFFIPDQMYVMYQGQTNIDTGMTNGSGTIVFNFSGSNSFVRIIMNPTNGNAGTAWTYSVSVSAVNSPTYSFTNFAGSMIGVSGTTDAAGSAAGFQNPQGVCVDSAGNVYVADTANHNIRKIDPAGNAATLAGTTNSGPAVAGPVAANTAQFNSPAGVAVDSAGNVYVADTGNHVIRKIDQVAATVTTIAGTGVAGSVNNASPLLAQFSSPNGIAVDGAGNIYIADTGNSLIRLMDNTGNVSTFAGSIAGYANGPAASARFSSPRGVDVDQNTNVFVADTGSQTIRQISGGNVSLLAGLAFSTVPAGQDGVGAAARFANPWGIAYDGSASLFVGDSANNTIRKVSLGGVVSTIGGAPPPAVAAYVDGTGSTARFSSPRGIGVAPGGDLFVADCNNHDIRKASFTVGSTKDKGVVVYYVNSGPVPGGAAKNGAVWLSRILTNNVFGYGGNDRFQAGLINNENGTNYIYVTGAAENQIGTNQFFIAKGKTNGIGLWIGTDNYAFSATNTNSSFGMALASVYSTNIVVAGYTNASLGLDSPYLVGYSTNGTQLYSAIPAAAPPAWSAATSYTPGAVVSYGGQVYVALTANLNKQPNISPADWSLTSSSTIGRYNGVTVFGTNIYAVGTTLTNASGDCLVDKWDLNGNFIQRQTYQLDPTNNDSLYGIVGVGCSGHLYAVGVRTNTGGTSSDGILLEIDPTTLAGISTNIVSVPPNLFNSANAITTDGTDLYVAATTLTTSGNGRDMMLFRYRVKNWYLPEESLSQLIGESSFGQWKLEMWDSRDSNSVPAATLKCWDINFSYAPVGTPAAVLVAGVPITRVTLANQPVYFVVPTPFGATHVTNTITATGKVSLVYNLMRTPVPGARGNVTIGTVTNGGKIVLGTGGATPFKPGQRYYLALIAGEGTGSVTAQVDFDQSAPPIPMLTSGIFSSGTRATGVGLDYYQFNVPSGSAGVLFDLEPVNGNVDLYVRKANTNIAAGAQLTTGQFDYRSINFGSHADQIFVVPGTGTVPLTPGTWYLGAANADIRPVNYNIRATSFGGAPYGVVPLASAVSVFGATTPGNAPNTMFKLTVATNTPSALFQVTSLSGNGDMILRRGNYPTVATNDFKSANSGTLAETIVVRTNSTWTNIGGDWYLGVVNNDPFDLTYTVTAHLPTNGLLISATPLALPNTRPAQQYLTNHAFGLDVPTLSGEKYQIQYKTNLSVTNWITLGTYIASSNGTITFVHTNALTNRSVIYRIQQVP